MWTLEPPPTERFTLLSGPRRTWWRGHWTPPDRPSPLLTWANTLVSGVPQQGRDVIGSRKRWMCVLLIQASTLGLERWTSVPLFPSRMSPWMIVSTVPIFLERDSLRCFTFQVRRRNLADLFKKQTYNNEANRVNLLCSTQQQQQQCIFMERQHEKKKGGVYHRSEPENMKHCQRRWEASIHSECNKIKMKTWRVIVFVLL